MNVIMIVMSVLVAILTFLAIMTKKKKIRIFSSLFVYMFLIGSAIFSMDAAARNVMTDSVNSGLHTKEFGDGVRKLREALSPVKAMVVICGAGLFLVSLKTQLGENRQKKKKNGAGP